MEREDIKVGCIYEVNPESREKCGTFKVYSRLKPKYIRVTRIYSSGSLGYGILDEKLRFLGTCSNCFFPEHLLREVKEGETEKEKTETIEFQVGDTVRVRTDHSASYQCSPDCALFTTQMEKYKGETAKIVKDRSSWNRYRLDIDDGLWCWSACMLEKLPNRLINHYPMKGGRMSQLQSLSTQQKKALSRNKQAMLQLGYIDATLVPTDKGRKAYIDWLMDRDEEAFGKHSQEEVKRVEKEEKEEKETKE